MTVTIDPDLYRWVSRGNNRSETVEHHLRARWREHEAQKIVGREKLRTLLDPHYAEDSDEQARINTRELAKKMLRLMFKHNFKSERLRMLRYELNKFIEEGAQSDE
tara:strand:+ start:255 stop:572 length:318 start_codon:yes stop_codon:yes gene_type:complete